MSLHSVFEDHVSPSLFEGINARYYRATEITQSFVPNQQFDNLVVRHHSLIVGPRGSGKTTLLRMLHPECLSVWKDPEAGKYRKTIDFSGIYLATDRVWREQVAAATAGLSEEIQEQFFATIFALDAMAAIVRTLKFRIRTPDQEGSRFREVAMGVQQVAELVAELAEGWYLRPKFRDLGSLRVALRRRRIEARQWVQHIRRGDAASERPVWLEYPWDDALLLAIDAFEAISGRTGELWALLLDEAEIAPPSLRNSVLRSTRGLDPRLLIKCSLSPWLQDSPVALSDQDGTVFNDYNVIRLFYGHRAESYDFSRDLIRARLAATGRNHSSDKAIELAVFGDSRFVGDVNGRGTSSAPAYVADSSLGKVVKNLARMDPNFRIWLAECEIDPERLDQLEGKQRAETLRKARNVMIARLEFRRASGLLRSRKTLAMYTGGTTMLDICEGNPRLLLGLLLPLLDYYDGRHPIPERLQAEALDQIADDFYALIDAIPVSPDARHPKELGHRPLRSPYREVIDRIARFFQDEILRGKFNPQPPSTLRIPRTLSAEFQRILGRLINVGAIVLVTDRGVKDVIFSDFDQQRLRLCYLVAAREHLPPNVDRPVSINRVLERATQKGARLPGMSEED